MRRFLFNAVNETDNTRGRRELYQKGVKKIVAEGRRIRRTPWPTKR
jgi:hypothetical protein